MLHTTKFVLQREDGAFYWKDKSVSSKHGFDKNFSRAYLFDSQKGARRRANDLNENCKVLIVEVSLVSQE